MSGAASRRFACLGKGEQAEGTWESPDRYRFFDDPQRIVSIPQGSGLSLAGASFGKGVRSVSLRRFNRILAFDEQAGRVVVEAGITLRQLFSFLAPRGWQVAVQPGFPDITVGGCIAGNVHGKNPLAHSCFGRWVEEATLVHPSHGRLTLSAASHPDLLELTIGGFGLTGYIVAATLRLTRLKSSRFILEPTPVASPEEALTVLSNASETMDQCYSWHDMATPRRKGSGIVFRGRHADEAAIDSAPVVPRYRSLDPDAAGLPVGALNRWGVPLVNAVYRSRWARPKELDLFSATFPFSANPEFFALYGPHGFLEHQSLVPWDVVPAYLKEIRRLLARHRVTPALFVLKPFGGTPGLLRFEGPGLSVALEATNGPETLALFADLDCLDGEMNARANILKDARLPKSAVEQQYPELDAFRRRLNIFDPDRLMRSALSERIGL